MNISINILRFCAEECSRQRSGEMSVFWMCTAYLYVLNSGKSNNITPGFIETLGAMVEPDKNENGFRNTPVMVPGVIKPPHHSLVPEQIRKLCAVLGLVSPVEFYRRFEEVHPFKDGNGRVGAILFNVLNGTLDDPVRPPKVFGE